MRTAHREVAALTLERFRTVRQIVPPLLAQGPTTVPRVALAIGMVCSKAGFGWTRVDDVAGKVADHAIEVPSNITARAEQLAWLFDEAVRVFDREPLTTVCIQAPGKGKFAASPERIEVGAIAQAAAAKVGRPCQMLGREGVRAALGEPKAAGAYERLLQRPEVQSRSNQVRREQYLLAQAGLA